MNKKNKPHIIGRNDIIDLPEIGLFDVPAKVDTGAYTSALSYINWELKDRELIITFENENGKAKTFKTRDYYQKTIKNSFGHAEKRYIIKTDVMIFGETHPTEFSLSKRSELKFPILLGRKFLKERFMVDVNRYKLSYKKKMKEMQ